MFGEKVASVLYVTIRCPTSPGLRIPLPEPMKLGIFLRLFWGSQQVIQSKPILKVDIVVEHCFYSCFEHILGLC